METYIIFAAFVAHLSGQVLSGSNFYDHSWTSVNCQEFQLVIEDYSNNTSDQILLQSGKLEGYEKCDGNKKEKSDRDDITHCFGVKRYSEDKLAFDNYGIRVSMLSVGSNQDNSGLMGLIFNFQDNMNYDFAYLA